MLRIKNLKAEIDNNSIIKGIDLEVFPGEIHILMGPNGSGKSSLASIIAGDPKYDITGGEILFEGKNLENRTPEERANKGIFLAFQYPMEIPGVNNSYFIRTALNAKKEYNNEKPINAAEFLKLLEEKRKKLNFDKSLLKRQVNLGFSGGEKKRNEILQMAVLEPKLSILDEIDSGLDVDALKNIGENIQMLQTKDNATIIITHYPRILKYINPTYIHILVNGKILKSGNSNLAHEIEREGYLKQY